MTKTCEHCGSEYAKPKRRAYWQFEQSRFCSRRCSAKRDQRIPDAQFKARYRQVKTPDGRKMLEHRWVMEQHVGRRLELVTSDEHGLRHTWRPLTTVCAICSVEFVPHKTKRGRTQTCGQRCGAQLTWRTRRANRVACEAVA